MSEHHCSPLSRFVKCYGREPTVGELFQCKPCGKSWRVVTKRGLKSFVEVPA